MCVLRMSHVAGLRLVTVARGWKGQVEGLKRRCYRMGLPGSIGEEEDLILGVPLYLPVKKLDLERPGGFLRLTGSLHS